MTNEEHEKYKQEVTEKLQKLAEKMADISGEIAKIERAPGVRIQVEIVNMFGVGQIAVQVSLAPGGPGPEGVTPESDGAAKKDCDCGKDGCDCGPTPPPAGPTSDVDKLLGDILKKRNGDDK